MPLALSSNNSLSAGTPPGVILAKRNGCKDFFQRFNCVANFPAAIRAKAVLGQNESRTSAAARCKSLFLSMLQSETITVDGKTVISEEQRRHPLAIFGISHKQRALGRIVLQDLQLVNVETIAKYNHRLGLIHYGRNEDPYYKCNKELFHKVCDYIIDIAENRLVTYRKENGRPLLSKAEYLDLSELYMNHFFRNTSKLGLKFFASRGDDIVFAWHTGKGSKRDLCSVLNKPWTAGERRNQQFEPITYSEIRAVIKDKRELFAGTKIFKLFVTKNNVEIAGSLTSDNWVRYDRPIVATS